MCTLRAKYIKLLMHGGARSLETFLQYTLYTLSNITLHHIIISTIDEQRPVLHKL